MPNRLAAESSLYLRQHADNPVDWWAWTDAALAQARAADLPVLLSIGYSACHWCHVMAHESFEDAATGELMNRLFVNIKVDREERPDLDRIYQLAHQALNRRGGGWPLTVFLDPHTLLPFHIGTYFPRQPRYGMPGFPEVLHGVRQWWDKRREQVTQQNEALRGFLADYGNQAAHAGALGDAPLRTALARLQASFDPVHGGHRGAPKFPPCGELELLLAWAREGGQSAAAMAATTMSRMATRGLHDHLGGGFFRYCVDERWDIPHFEKMLYDNALLLPLYAEAAAAFDSPVFRATAAGTVDWLRAEMRADGGGFCSALDADSEGEEGRFYLWTREQFAALDAGIRPLAQRRYGLDRAANFEDERWHLHAATDIDDLAQASGADIAAPMQAVRWQLLALRNQRIRPARDDKRLCAWNALLCSGLARAGDALERDDWIDEAVALIALIADAVDDRGRLPAVLGKAGPGFLDDHAFALQACLDMLRVRWSNAALALAIRLADTLLRDFADSARGGFHFTAHDHEALPQRPKPWLDEATPSGNGVSARALQELGLLLGEPRYLDAAEACLRAGWSAIGELPQAASSMLLALREWLAPTPQLVIRGDPPALRCWQDSLRAEWPQALRIYAIAAADAQLPAALATKPRHPQGAATLCRGTTCYASKTGVHEVLAQLRRLPA
jgi:hypothetical protein